MTSARRSRSEPRTREKCFPQNTGNCSFWDTSSRLDNPSDRFYAGCIYAEASRMLAAEVVIQAIRDFSLLRRYRHKDIMSWGGARCVTEKEMGRLKKFFSNGDADFWLEAAGIPHDGKAIWETISQHPGRRVASLGDFSNRSWL